MVLAPQCFPLSVVARAMTLGSRNISGRRLCGCLNLSREHEHVHVRQYEAPGDRWDDSRPIPPPGSGCGLQDLDRIFDNPFEREALRARSGRWTRQTAVDFSHRVLDCDAPCLTARVATASARRKSAVRTSRNACSRVARPSPLVAGRGTPSFAARLARYVAVRRRDTAARHRLQ